MYAQKRSKTRLIRPRKRRSRRTLYTALTAERAYTQKALNILKKVIEVNMGDSLCNKG